MEWTCRHCEHWSRHEGVGEVCAIGLSGAADRMACDGFSREPGADDDLNLSRDHGQ